jgi:hypothetical protein
MGREDDLNSNVTDSSALMLSPSLSNTHVVLCAVRDGRPDLVAGP